MYEVIVKPARGKGAEYVHCARGTREEAEVVRRRIAARFADAEVCVVNTVELVLSEELLMDWGFKVIRPGLFWLEMKHGSVEVDLDAEEISLCDGRELLVSGAPISSVWCQVIAAGAGLKIDMSVSGRVAVVEERGIVIESDRPGTMIVGFAPWAIVMAAEVMK